MVEKRKDEIRYHGLTLDQIKAKYYVNLEGDENFQMLNYLNGRLSKLWQDVAFYLSDTKSELSNLERRLENLDDQLELDEEKCKWRLICDNKVSKAKFRWSDDARKTAAHVETRSDKLLENINIIKNSISFYKEELAIWETTKKNLSYVADRVDNSTMNLASEGKMTRKEPTNIPDTKDLDNKEVKTPEEKIEDKRTKNPPGHIDEQDDLF